MPTMASKVLDLPVLKCLLLILQTDLHLYTPTFKELLVAPSLMALASASQFLHQDSKLAFIDLQGLIQLVVHKPNHSVFEFISKGLSCLAQRAFVSSK